MQSFSTCRKSVVYFELTVRVKKTSFELRENVFVYIREIRGKKPFRSSLARTHSFVYIRVIRGKKLRSSPARTHSFVFPLPPLSSPQKTLSPLLPLFSYNKLYLFYYSCFCMYNNRVILPMKCNYIILL